MRLLLLFLLLLLPLMQGCLTNDNDKNSVADPGEDSAQVTEASVALLLRDEALEDYDEVNLRLQQVSLLPHEDSDAADEVVLYAGDQTVNLLDLRHHAELFSVNDQVPEGDYALVRLYSAEVVELVTYAEDEGEAQKDQARLDFAYLDLLLDTPLVAQEGETTYLEVDIDLQMSLLSYDESEDRYYFEPTASARILDAEADAGGSTEAPTQADAPFVSVRGLLREENLVCPSAQAAAAACTQLAQDETTALYTEEGQLIPADQLPLGAAVIAMGQLKSVEGSGQRALQTAVVMLGQRPTINIRSLRVTQVRGEEGITLANGRQASWAEGAQVLTQQGQPVALDELTAPFQASVLGRFSPGHLESVALLLLQEEPSAVDEDATEESGRSQVLRAEFEEQLDGEGVSIQVSYQGELVSVDVSAARLVVAGSGRIAAGDREQALAELQPGTSLMVKGIFQDEGVFLADHLVVHRLPPQRRAQGPSQ